MFHRGVFAVQAPVLNFKLIASGLCGSVLCSSVFWLYVSGLFLCILPGGGCWFAGCFAETDQGNRCFAVRNIEYFPELVFVIEGTSNISIYILPFCIVPIIVKNFYDDSLALYIHLVIVLIALSFQVLL